MDKLRNAINGELKRDESRGQQLVRGYLGDKFNIFKRLGIHFVREYPAAFLDELRYLLNTYENLDDYSIHHEFFLLLRDGFSYLASDDQQTLLEKIMEGPPEVTINMYRKWWNEPGFPKTIGMDEYVKRQIKHWRLIRLWMIREHLPNDANEIFVELYQELGEPDFPPEFTSYSTEVRQIRDESPLSANEIYAFSPPELIAFLLEWKPNANRSLWPNQQTYSSLGREVAKVIFENPNRYKAVLFDIAKIRSGYGYAIVDEFSKLNRRTDELWQMIIELCGRLLGLEEVRLAVNPRVDDSWYYFRNSLVNLLRDGFSNPQKKVPEELLEKVKGILLILVNDPDPDEERDKPSKANSGFGDPSHVALNSNRPIALNSLITCAMEEHKLQRKDYTHEIGPKRLAPDVRDVLDEKLDIHKEPSWAMRSVFGERLPNLFWLDKEWTEMNLERIFPNSEDEESRWLFVSAISSYAIFRNFFVEIFDKLKPVYAHAIVLFSKGYLWKTHLQPVSHLAGHLIWGYLLSDHDIDLSNLDNSNLFIKFFLAFDAEGRKDGAFICRRILDIPENVEKYWKKIRRIWEWRVQESVRAGHTSDFDGEMLQFAQLVTVAPEGENIQSLWPLLTATVPHFHGMQFRDWGWDAIEDFLAKKVETEPLWAIKLYAMMYNQAPPRWLPKRDATRKIIETAARNEEAKQLACDLINFIGSRLGDDSYRDIFENYC